MPWVRFADDYLFNPKVAVLSVPARLLDMSAIIYSARELRDGYLSHLDVQVIAAAARIRKPPAAELVRAGRWEPTDEGYAIHDYLSFQPSRDQVLAEREKARARKRKADGTYAPDSGRSSPGINPDSGRIPAEVRSTPYPYPVNSPDPDPEPPRTPPDEQGGRWTSRRGRRRSVEYDQTPIQSPQDEHELWCPEHTGKFNSECLACRQIEIDYVNLRLSTVPR